jgi:oligogalacturonide transporter
MQQSGGSERLSFWRKVGFGLGDIYGGGSGIIIGFWYLYFLTDVIRINAALAGVVLLVSKLYDAVTDPFEGIITDRTRTKMGRRRPYLLAGIPLVFLSFFFLFYPVDFNDESARFIFVMFAYLFFSTVVSIVGVSYNALAAELSLDYHERTSISSFRIFFSTFSSILCAVLPLEIVKLFPDVHQGYIAMATMFGLFFAAPFVVTFFSVRERKEFQHENPPFSWRATFLEPFRVRTFWTVLLMYILAFVAMDAVSSIVIYFMKYYLGRGNEANYVSGALLVAQVASLPFYVGFSRRTSKRAGYMLGAAVWMAAMLFSFALVPGGPGWVAYAFAVVVGLGTGGIVVMVYAMFPDIPDVDELVSGQRREGTYSALTTFSRKLSSALALFMISNGLAIAGYRAPIEQAVNGVTKVVEQVQSDTFLLELRLIFVFVPIVLVGLALFFARRYPLDSATHVRLNKILALRRSGGVETAEQQVEALALAKKLVG